MVHLADHPGGGYLVRIEAIAGRQSPVPCIKGLRDPQVADSEGGAESAAPDLPSRVWLGRLMLSSRIPGLGVPGHLGHRAPSVAPEPLSDSESRMKVTCLVYHLQC